MIHNDVLRSVRYMLDISDNKMVELIKLGGMDVTKEDLLTYLKKDEEEGFVFCPDEVMAHFLDGLVIFNHEGRTEETMARCQVFPAKDFSLVRFSLTKQASGCNRCRQGRNRQWVWHRVNARCTTDGLNRERLDDKGLRRIVKPEARKVRCFEITAHDGDIRRQARLDLN